MNTVFLDTVGLIALWDEDDQWHQPASSAMKLLDAAGGRFITTSYILLECANALARTSFRVDVSNFRDRLAQQNDLIEPSDDEIETAWSAYRADRPGGASIVDHLSFVVMRRLGVTRVFSNDHHFRTAAFETLF